MRWQLGFALSTSLIAFLMMAASLWPASRSPARGRRPATDPAARRGGQSETATQFVERLMAFNKAKDGKLTKVELSDTRLHALFDRADSNKDGVVTRAELAALYDREKLEGGFGFGGDGPKGKGKKGPDGKKPPPEGR